MLVDAGPLVASMVVRDDRHAEVAAFLRGNKEVLAIPTAVLPEISHFLLRHNLVREEARFLRSIATRRLTVVDAVLPDYARAADLVEQYADFPLGTVDALIVAMAERLKVTTILTLDRRHFGAIQPLHCDKFTLAP